MRVEKIPKTGGMKKYRIYALYDNNNNPFYVGVTMRKLSIRLIQHKNAALRMIGCNAEKDKKIMECGDSVTIVLLDTAYTSTKKEAMDIETAWIHRFNSMGIKLTNIFQTYY